jgi:hypothetical protein
MGVTGEVGKAYFFLLRLHAGGVRPEVFAEFVVKHCIAPEYLLIALGPKKKAT